MKFKQSLRSFRAFITPVGSVALLAAAAAPAAVTAPTFQGIGDLPGGSAFSAATAVSGEGSVVVGTSSGSSGNQAVRWTRDGGLVGLGDLAGGSFSSAALGVSSDGSVVVGRGSPATGSEAFRWTQAGGMAGLGRFEGASVPFSEVRRVSANGTTAVGFSNVAGGQRAFRWTQAAGLQDLGDLAGGANSSSAFGVSPDGSAVTGTSSAASGLEAFRWTQASGLQSAGTITGTAVVINGASEGGEFLAGSGRYAQPSQGGSMREEGILFSEAGGLVRLGDLPGGSFNSKAFAASADGSVVVGTSIGQTGGVEPFYWTAAGGMRPLRTVLEEDFGLGPALAGWTLTSASGISADGRAMVGGGFGPNGEEGWVAVVPEPASIGLLALGSTVMLARRRRDA